MCDETFNGAHLMPSGKRFITWDLPVDILVDVAQLLAQSEYL